jgi:PEP-CTERM motif-containing protein
MLVAPVAAAQIGFNFTGRVPGSSDGDSAAPTHLFIHHYAVAQPGLVTGVTFRNDSDVNSPEPISVLILRPVVGGWNVIDRENLPDSAFHHGLLGNTTYTFAVPVPVNVGDIFAHWQLQGAGPIPNNLDQTHVEGLSNGRFGFSSSAVDPGKFIANAGFSGARDYFINLDFVTVPEPSTIALGITGGGLVVAGVRRRKSGTNLLANSLECPSIAPVARDRY